MFYDERIETGRSNAFRKTMILATFLFIVHSLINGIVRFFTVSTFSFLDILAGTLCAIIGIAFILYGEICFRESDEMTEFQKNRYYNNELNPTVALSSENFHIHSNCFIAELKQSLIR